MLTCQACEEPGERIRARCCDCVPDDFFDIGACAEHRALVITELRRSGWEVAEYVPESP